MTMAPLAKHIDITAFDAIDRNALPEDGGPDFNRLIFERSPYLLQHASNPVDWHPWGDRAFIRARSEDKPIFLSIGYSTCHWCHVMAHESFADPAVAAVLARDFVAIKVDREERPDVDAAYMTACQMMTGSGGWPLTVLLTPDRRPFFAATYLPRESRGGLPGLIALLEQVAVLWRTQRPLLLDVGERTSAAILDLEQHRGAPTALDDRSLRQALSIWRDTFDTRHAGFGGAPKFPTPHALSLLWRLGERLKTPDAAQMAGATLLAIRRGGIYDQIGFGLHRYAVDASWTVPHFEKMLYDQALFILAALDGFQATGDPAFAAMARDTVEYLLRDLHTDRGAFCCGEDADSEGVEGTFYLWTPEQVRAALPRELAELACRAYGIGSEGNFEGKNIPTHAVTPAELAVIYGVTEEELVRQLEQARRALLAHRAGRTRPHRDDKVLTGWNGLAAGAVARAGALLGEPEWIAAAAETFAFLQTALVDQHGRLQRSWRRGTAAIPGFAEDYAWLTWGLTELHQARQETKALEQALRWNEEALRLFADGEGDLWECGLDAEAVLGRGRTTVDGAMPAAGSVLALNLLRLGDLTGIERLPAAGERLLRTRLGRLGSHPEAHAQLLIALDYALGPRQQVVVSVTATPSQADGFLHELRRRFLPRALILVTDGADEALDRLTTLTVGRRAREGHPCAWLCSGQSCQLPATNAGELGRQLETMSGRFTPATPRETPATGGE
ncbi:MAG: thioredoxin domain-containing protein [Desulfuromonadales bacterium]|nr:thioredoxin domain-containing protein [Desulfuromonadales bacterium]